MPKEAIKTQPKTEIDFEDEAKGKRGRKAGAILFPRNSLLEALKVPKVIWEQNAGNPYPLLDIAVKLGNSPTSSTFREMIRSAQRYGLTNESFTQELTKTISITSLGNSIVAPTPEDDVNALKRKALETADLFQKVLNSLQGKIIPPADSFKNLLIRTYHLDKNDAETCYEILTQNMNELGLVDDVQGKLYLRLDKLGQVSKTVSEQGASESPTEGVEPPEHEKTAPKIEEKQVPKQIFVAHGKNKKPLEQLKEILGQFNVPFQVAIDEPHKGRAISEKVAEIMKNCTSGIFIFTADEETVDSENNKILRPSDNVVFELGAGTILYGKKILLFREEGVQFGSDFTEYGHYTFEKDKLDSKALDLMKELISQGFLQVTPR